MRVEWISKRPVPLRHGQGGCQSHAVTQYRHFLPPPSDRLAGPQAAQVLSGVCPSEWECDVLGTGIVRETKGKPRFVFLDNVISRRSLGGV